MSDEATEDPMGKHEDGHIRRSMGQLSARVTAVEQGIIDLDRSLLTHLEGSDPHTGRLDAIDRATKENATQIGCAEGGRTVIYNRLGIIEQRQSMAEATIASRTGSAHRRINEMNEQLVKRIKVLEGRADNRTQGESELRERLAGIDQATRVNARETGENRRRLKKVEEACKRLDASNDRICGMLDPISDRISDLEHPPERDDPPVEPEQAGEEPCTRLSGKGHSWRPAGLIWGDSEPYQYLVANRECGVCGRGAEMRFSHWVPIAEIWNWQRGIVTP